LITLSLGKAYRSFGGEWRRRTPPRYAAFTDSGRHQLWAIAQRAALPTGAGSQLRPVNPSSGLLYVKTGAANVTADSNALPLLPSSSEIVTVDGAATNIATYASATAGPLLVTRGEGR